MQPATAATNRHAVARATRVHRAAGLLAVYAGMLALAGCSPGRAPVADAQALASARAPLAWTVNAAHVTPRIATASMETKQAPPGYQFVVLDVSVRNRDSQPQVLSEGALVAMDESDQHIFDQPETLLSPDYLSLQVLAPSQRLRGKIAFEVPDPLSGVLFWSPGNNNERILLNLTTPTGTPRTLANAGDERADEGVDDRARDTDVDPAQVAATRIEPSAQVESAPAAAVARAPATTASVRPGKRPSASAPGNARAMAADVVSSRRRVPAPVVALPSAPMPGDTVAERPAALAVSSAEVPRVVASITPPALQLAPAGASPRVATGDPRALPPGANLAASADDNESSRRHACQALLSRDDAVDKAGNLGFFAQSCRDYPLPASWRPPPAPHRSLLSRASALLARVVLRPRVTRISDCGSTASRTDRLVCADPDLSAMDHQLAQSVARAREEVDDPQALQRDQAAWRGRVRDACRSARCLQQAYGRRIVQLDALASAPR